MQHYFFYTFENDKKRSIFTAMREKRFVNKGINNSVLIDYETRKIHITDWEGATIVYKESNRRSQHTQEAL